MITGFRRSALYVPGDSARMLEKALTIPADMLLLNLEDGIAQSKKGEARALVAQFLGSANFGEREVVVRINGAEIGQRDLQALVPHGPDGICLPKVENASEIQAADSAVRELEIANGVSESSVRLHALIESAAGVLHASEIAAASPRMASLMFGSADYTKDIRCRPGEDRAELWLALQWIVTAARAGGIDAIDAPCFDIRNAALLQQEAVQARRLGYDGKSAIHPSQIEIINAVFDVTEEEIAWAEKVMAELDAAEDRGKGLSTLGGRLIENPHRASAEQILRRKRR